MTKTIEPAYTHPDGLLYFRFSRFSHDGEFDGRLVWMQAIKTRLLAGGRWAPGGPTSPHHICDFEYRPADMRLPVDNEWTDEAVEPRMTRARVEGKLSPRITPEFLATFEEGARLIGWSVDLEAVWSFYDEMRRIAGLPPADRIVFEPLTFPEDSEPCL